MSLLFETRLVFLVGMWSSHIGSCGADETLLGKDGFRKGMDLYFDRHDGEAVTCDDFLAAMADANGEDLSLMSKCVLPPAPLPPTLLTTHPSKAPEHALRIQPPQGLLLPTSTDSY